MTQPRKPRRTPRYRSPWPRGWRFHPRNDPIAALPDDHPAKRLLFIHEHCLRECAGREIARPGREHEAFDQEFTSQVDPHHRWRFSGLIYAHICFTLILTEWLEHPPKMTEGERNVLAGLPGARAMFAECRVAAERNGNVRVLELLPLPLAFYDAWEASILARLKQDGIPYDGVTSTR